jgi:hypothetical protein
MSPFPAMNSEASFLVTSPSDIMDKVISIKKTKNWYLYATGLPGNRFRCFLDLIVENVI